MYNHLNLQLFLCVFWKEQINWLLCMLSPLETEKENEKVVSSLLWLQRKLHVM